MRQMWSWLNQPFRALTNRLSPRGTLTRSSRRKWWSSAEEEALAPRSTTLGWSTRTSSFSRDGSIATSIKEIIIFSCSNGWPRRTPVIATSSTSWRMSRGETCLKARWTIGKASTPWPCKRPSPSPSNSPRNDSKSFVVLKCPLCSFARSVGDQGTFFEVDFTFPAGLVVWGVKGCAWFGRRNSCPARIDWLRWQRIYSTE